MQLTSTETQYAPNSPTVTGVVVTTVNGLGQTLSVNEYGPSGTSATPYSTVTFSPDPANDQVTETQQFTVNGVTSPSASLVQKDQGLTGIQTVSLNGQPFSKTTTTLDAQGLVTGIDQNFDNTPGSLWRQGTAGQNKSETISYWGTGQRQTLTRSQGGTAAGFTNYSTTFSPSTKVQTNVVENWRQDSKLISKFQTTTDEQLRTNSSLVLQYSSAAASTLLVSNSTSYVYDVLGQLKSTSVVDINGNSPPPNNTGYSASGNPSAALKVVNDRVLRQDSYLSFQYDLEGHVEQALSEVAAGESYLTTTTDYTWDNRGELTSATTTNTNGAVTFKAVYVYDGLRRMIAETDTNSAGTGDRQGTETAWTSLCKVTVAETLALLLTNQVNQAF